MNHSLSEGMNRMCLYSQLVLGQTYAFTCKNFFLPCIHNMKILEMDSENTVRKECPSNVQISRILLSALIGRFLGDKVGCLWSLNVKLQLDRLLCPQGFSRQEYRSGLPCLTPTQGLNPGFPHCRWILHCLRHQGSTFYLWAALTGRKLSLIFAYHSVVGY